MDEPIKKIESETENDIVLNIKVNENSNNSN